MNIISQRPKRIWILFEYVNDAIGLLDTNILKILIKSDLDWSSMKRNS